MDGLPPIETEYESPPPASGTGVGRIDALPDHMLQHVISFLPAQAAVRTCMLARRWRHLWRSTTSGLRIVGLHGPVDAKDLRVFVDHLLILRERTDLGTVEIEFEEFSDDDVPYLKLWTRFAVTTCKARAFTLHVNGDTDLTLDYLLLSSRHLTALDLQGVELGTTTKEDLVDFACCPALVDLKMDSCEISAAKISSPSLKHLSIAGCSSDCHRRLHVYAPGLVSLNLVQFWGNTTPFLGNMTLLETARVHLDNPYQDVCLYYDSGVHCGANHHKAVNDDCSSDVVLLGGISSAKHLELISHSQQIIFARDLIHCPTFSNLKTLLLNEYWCEADLIPLACILKHSPVLEKLTLQLFSKGPDHKVEIKGSYSAMERSSEISAYLNIVEVKCNTVDEKILKVLRFMCALNIRFSFE